MLIVDFLISAISLMYFNRDFKATFLFFENYNYLFLVLPLLKILHIIALTQLF